MTKENDTTGTLKIGEYHPSSNSAMAFVKYLITHPDYLFLRESLESNAIDGNRCCEICLETLIRVENNDLVSDRYLLGLAWFLKDFIEAGGKK